MQKLDSKEVAEMLGKRHDNFLREIRKYISSLENEASEYFVEVTYINKRNRECTGYEITAKGCELIAGRLIGAKSEEFKGKYKALFTEEPVDPPQGYSTEEVAQMLGCSRRTVQRMIQRGELTTTQVTILVPTVKTVVAPDELARYRKERVAV